MAAADKDFDLGTDDAQGSMARRTVQGSAVTLGSQIAKLGAQFVGLAALGRLLAPGDFGLVAMVTAITGFVTVFADLGLSSATIQRPAIDREQLNTLFWINLGASCALFLVVVVLAPLIASFYGDQRLITVTVVLALTFPISGAAIQQRALLRRHLRFGTMALVEFLALAGAVSCAVAVAYYLNAGYWAIVVQHTAHATFGTIGIWLVSRWRPQFGFSPESVRSMLLFGGNVAGFNVVNYVARHLDDVLIGRFWGSRQLGLYSVAYRLLLVPIGQINTPIAAVALPILSRLAPEAERYRRAYLRIVEKIALMTLPAVALLIVTSDWVIELVLGPQWTDASRIFTMLAFSAIVQPVSNTVGWLFISQDRTGEYLRWGVIGAGLSVIAILAGLPWGAIGVASAYGVSGLVVRTPLLYWLVGRRGPVRTKDLYRTIAAPALAAGSVILGLIGFRQIVPVQPLLVMLLEASVLAVALAALTLTLVPSGRRAIRDSMATIRLLRHERDNVSLP